jgi:protein gp37
MGKDSGIGWTDHTFNPWWGCVKVARGCQNCYAMSNAKRYGHDVWGLRAERRLMSERYWNQPRKWDREAGAEGRRAKVFCGSMSDVFEVHGVERWFEAQQKERARLWALIAETPNLDWLLLTKRPWNVDVLGEPGWLEPGLPRNVWLGTSASDHDEMVEWWQELDLAARKLKPTVLFLSLEPLLGPVNIEALWKMDVRPPDWIIVGCESKGANVGSLGDFGTEGRWRGGAEMAAFQCQRAGAACFVKQIPLHGALSKDVGEWPLGLQFQEFPNV